jgi:methionyl-tRNA formyltransferase
MNEKQNILFLSSNKMGFEVFKQCIETVSANFYVMTLSKQSKVVMYDGIDNRLWDDYCENVIRIDSIRESRIENLINSLGLDLIIMCGWRQIIPDYILEIPRLGMIAFHPTPLPKGRGSAPIINSILEGWEESAVTLFFPDKGVDSGDIINQEFFRINDNDYAIDVYNKCIEAGKNLIKNNLSNVLLKKPNLRKKQDNKNATYLKKISLKDNEINLTDDPDMIYKKIRAFSKPYLGAFIRLNGNKLIIEKGVICTKIKK